MRKCYGLALTGFLLVMPAPRPADAATWRPHSEPGIADCIRVAAAGRVWMERTLWGLHDQEGGWVGARLSNRDGSHDLGPLQVNSWWVPRIAKLLGRPEREISQWLQHDACFNVDAAKWIFLSGLAATHDYWRAIGIYHSPTPVRQTAYARNVAQRMQRRFGPEIFASARHLRRAAQPNTSSAYGREQGGGKKPGLNHPDHA